MRPGCMQDAENLAKARHELDRDEQVRLAPCREHARKIHERDGDMETCSMCGDLCAVKMVQELLAENSKKK